MKVFKHKVLVTFLIIGVILVVLGGIAYKWFNRNDVSNGKFDKTVKVTNNNFEYKNSEKDNKVAVRDEEEVYKDMHRMANTKIVADEIWGEDEISEERLNKVILEVMKSSYEDKEKLLTMLRNWKTGNFKNAVEEHNYLWEKLGGNLGKAKALRKQE